jgi:hypothetical protein
LAYTTRLGKLRKEFRCVHCRGLSRWTNFGLKQYDQAIDWARRAIAIGPNNPFPQAVLTAALALSGHEAEAREALPHYVALPSSSQLRRIAALKTYEARFANVNTDPRVLESNERGEIPASRSETPAQTDNRP